MKKIDIGQALHILANVGVIAGILLLAYELNQNRRMAAAQTRNELQQGLVEMLMIPAGNMQLAELVVRANAGGELSPAEVVMVHFRSESTFRYWENVHYQYRQGMYDESEFSKHLQTMEVVLSRNAGLVKYWCEDRDLYSVRFREAIDAMREAVRCSQTER
jgi:hypothetical protein